MIIKVDGNHRGAPMVTYVCVGGTEISSFYNLYGVKVHKSSVWEKINQCESINLKSPSIGFTQVNSYW